MPEAIQSISFIGSGHTATRLAAAFHHKGFIIKEVFSRSLSSARALARKVNAKPVNNLSALDADLLIIAVSDNAIRQVASRMKNTGMASLQGMASLRLLVHTSGSTPMSVLKQASGNIGVFYPLQTLQKSVDIDFSEIPICVEANNRATEKALMDLARRISSRVYHVDSEHRKILHLAAVFACNFSNHMYAIAGELLKQTGLDFSILRPLIIETAGRAGEYLPSQVQTGPAARKDKKIISLHLQMLKNNPEIRKIYRLVSDHIMNDH